MNNAILVENQYAEGAVTRHAKTLQEGQRVDELRRLLDLLVQNPLEEAKMKQSKTSTRCSEVSGP